MGGGEYKGMEIIYSSHEVRKCQILEVYGGSNAFPLHTRLQGRSFEVFTPDFLTGPRCNVLAYLGEVGGEMP